MEYCNGGSLSTYIEEMRHMPEDKIWDFLYQFCKGYQVLLDANLIHRDIKPDNILINDGVFKIADFGLSKRIRDPSLIENLSFKGSPLYMAPEIIEEKEGNSKIDVFSLGCVVYELAYDGSQPFVE
jgi:serine/threonine protein kinase